MTLAWLNIHVLLISLWGMVCGFVAIVISFSYTICIGMHANTNCAVLKNKQQILWRKPFFVKICYHDLMSDFGWIMGLTNSKYNPSGCILRIYWSTFDPCESYQTGSNDNILYSHNEHMTRYLFSIVKIGRKEIEREEWIGYILGRVPLGRLLNIPVDCILLQLITFYICAKCKVSVLNLTTRTPTL